MRAYTAQVVPGCGYGQVWVLTKMRAYTAPEDFVSVFGLV